MLGNIKFTEILVIALIVLLLFGARKIPDLMKNLGKGINSFKQGMNDITKDIETKSDENKDKNEQKNA